VCRCPEFEMAKSLLEKDLVSHKEESVISSDISRSAQSVICPARFMPGITIPPKVKVLVKLYLVDQGELK
jgi:hypothetical protein